MQLMDRVSLMHFNLSPQGDGNVFVLRICLVLFDFNLSPQGDGNSSLASFFGLMPYFNLSPQGDGNKEMLILTHIIAGISTYPRKGTETISPSA